MSEAIQTVRAVEASRRGDAPAVAPSGECAEQIILYRRDARELDLVIDEEIRLVVGQVVARDPKHDARTGGERLGCDFAALQKENLTALLQGGDSDGMGALRSKREVDRPIFVWQRGDQLVIVDGIKTYLEARRLGKSVEVREITFEDIEEAKAWRWYVNVAAACLLPEDARVWAFLQEFGWLTQRWRQEGSRNQGRKGVFPKSEKLNWRQRAARLCQTTRSRIDAVYDLRRDAEWAAALTPAQRAELTPREVAKVKIVEDGVKSVLSGARAASSVNSDIKGGASRGSKSTKGSANEGTSLKPPPANAVTVYDPNLESQLIVGDSLAIMPTLPVGAFKYLMGSPPYYRADVNYGFPIPWLESWEAYQKAIGTYIREAYRIIPTGGGIILNVDDTRDRETNRWYYHTELIRRICLDLGMYDAGVICWSKQNVTGKKHAKGSNNRSIIRPNHEYVVAFFKGRPYVDFPSCVYGEMNHLTLSTWVEDTSIEEINAEHWAMFSNFWEIAPAHDPNHPAIYPPKLAYRMLTRFTGAGDLVLDPWAGTGTTLVQCIMTGRPYLGIEYGPGYAELAAENIRKAKEATTKMSVNRLTRIEQYLKSKFVIPTSGELDSTSEDEHE